MYRHEGNKGDIEAGFFILKRTRQVVYEHSLLHGVCTKAGGKFLSPK